MVDIIKYMEILFCVNPVGGSYAYMLNSIQKSLMMKPSPTLGLEENAHTCDYDDMYI